MSGRDGGKGAAAAARILVDDYQTQDYRGFLLVRHETYGLMLLHCTRKKSKPPHWQLPGGHIDEPEFRRAAAEGATLREEEDNRNRQLLLAGKSGAARELFEETGIDVRAQLERLEPADLHRDNKPDSKKLVNEYKHRLFFFLNVTDQDFVKHGVGAMGTDSPDCPYKHVKVRLSVSLSVCWRVATSLFGFGGLIHLIAIVSLVLFLLL